MSKINIKNKVSSPERQEDEDYLIGDKAVEYIKNALSNADPSQVINDIQTNHGLNQIIPGIYVYKF